MNILIDIAHPGHVHLFRHLYSELTTQGHRVFVSTRNIPVVLRLLQYYQIPFFNLGDKKQSLAGKALSTVSHDMALLRFVRKNDIELGLSSHIILSHVSRLTGMKSILFDDDDDAVEPLVVKFGHRFAHTVLSPGCITRKTSKNIGYQGTHELAYLHPARFTPDPSVLTDAGLREGERFFILRFVAFGAHHDIGQSGLGPDQKRRIIEKLRPYGKIFITSEKPIEPEFEEYRLSIPPEKIHSLISYAAMFLGDSQTMTSEAAVLGVPALKCNTFAGRLSVPDKLEKEFGLCYSFTPASFDAFMEKAGSILELSNSHEVWAEKRNRFLQKSIDVTSFFTWFILHYPESRDIMKQTPSVQEQFI